jgi:hypothetical protein
MGAGKLHTNYPLTREPNVGHDVTGNNPKTVYYLFHSDGNLPATYESTLSLGVKGTRLTHACSCAFAPEWICAQLNEFRKLQFVQDATYSYILSVDPDDQRTPSA